MNLSIYSLALEKCPKFAQRICQLPDKTLIENYFYPLDIDECASDPCQNGGTCVDKINRYNCECEDGYTGTNCETGQYSISILIFNQHVPCGLFWGHA